MTLDRAANTALYAALARGAIAGDGGVVLDGAIARLPDPYDGEVPLALLDGATMLRARGERLHDGQ